MSFIIHKRGDSFELQGRYTDDLGNPIRLDSPVVTIRSQVRRRDALVAADGTPLDTLVADLTVEPRNQETEPGRYSLKCLDTRNWPIGVLLTDIEYQSGGVTDSTDPLPIRVKDRVTLPATGP